MTRRVRPNRTMWMLAGATLVGVGLVLPVGAQELPQPHNQALGGTQATKASGDTDNIIRAVRAWSHDGGLDALGDASLITHGIGHDGHGDRQAIGQRGADPSVGHLPVNGRDGVLSGEEDRMTWSVFLTAQDLASPVDVDLGFLNAATVLPESSRLTLSINGVRLATQALRFPHKTGRLKATIPARYLRVGNNELLVEADQYHRVDCSLDGSFELWTAIDLQSSVVRHSSGPHRYATLADLAAFPRASDQSVALNLAVPEGGNQTSRHFESLMGLMQQTIQAGRIKKPVVNMLPSPDDAQTANAASIMGLAAQSQLDSPAPGEAGIDLFVGSVAQLQAHEGLRAVYGAQDWRAVASRQRSSVAMVPSPSGHRLLLARLDELAPLPDGFAFLSQRQAVHPVLEDGATRSLKELGYSGREYTGMRFTERFELTLPADFYAADYDSLDFHLYGSYAADLDKAEMQLLINGTRKISVPVRDGTDGLIDNRVVKLPLSAFSAGLNQIEIVGLFKRRAEDAQCATRLNRLREAVFFLSEESYFAVPKLAHLAVLPNIRTTLTTGFPYRQRDGRGPLQLEIHDQASRGGKVAAQFLATLSAQSGEVIPVALAGTSNVMPSLPGASQLARQVEPRPGPGQSRPRRAKNRVIVGSYDAIPQHYAKPHAGVDIARLAKLSHRPDLMGLDVLSTAAIGGGQAHPVAGYGSNDSMPPVQTLPPSMAGVEMIMPGNGESVQNAPLAQQGLRAMFRERAEKDRQRFGFFDLTDRIKDLANPIGDAVAKGSLGKEERAGLPDSSAALISQNSEDDVVTTLISYNMYTGSILSFDDMFTTTRSAHARLHTVGLDTLGDGLIQLKSEADWQMMDPFSAGRNWHLVFAGWLSNNPLFYGAASLLSLLLFGVLSSLMLRRTRRSVGEAFDEIN